jgi:hypothetical protein
MRARLFHRLDYFLFVDKPGAMKESAVFLILTHARRSLRRMVKRGSYIPTQQNHQKSNSYNKPGTGSKQISGR